MASEGSFPDRAVAIGARMQQPIVKHAGLQADMCCKDCSHIDYGRAQIVQSGQEQGIDVDAPIHESFTCPARRREAFDLVYQNAHEDVWIVQQVLLHAAGVGSHVRDEDMMNILVSMDNIRRKHA